MEQLRSKKGFICDMDGVIYHGNRLLPGVKEFVDWLYRENKNFLFLTNSSDLSPREYQQKLARMGLDVDQSHFYTSALATASFIRSQSPNGSAYVIGDHGLMNALYDAGITINTVDPEFVIVGETENYGYEHIVKAINFVYGLGGRDVRVESIQHVFAELEKIAATGEVGETYRYLDVRE